MDVKAQIKGIMLKEMEIAVCNLIFYAKLKKIYDAKLAALETMSPGAAIECRQQLEALVKDENKKYIEKMNAIVAAPIKSAESI